MVFILTLAFVTEHFLSSQNFKHTRILDITQKNVALQSCYPVKAFIFQRGEQMLKANYVTTNFFLFCMCSPLCPLPLPCWREAFHLQCGWNNEVKRSDELEGAIVRNIGAPY